MGIEQWTRKLFRLTSSDYVACAMSFQSHSLRCAREIKLMGSQQCSFAVQNEMRAECSGETEKETNEHYDWDNVKQFFLNISYYTSFIIFIVVRSTCNFFLHSIQFEALFLNSLCSRLTQYKLNSLEESEFSFRFCLFVIFYYLYVHLFWGFEQKQQEQHWLCCGVPSKETLLD